MPSELDIELNGLNLTALVWGEEDKPVILALHGWLDNAMSFAPLAPYLSDYRVIALELPGHGHSDHLPPGQSYHFIDSVRLVCQVLDALQLKSVLMMGHSLGGAIATILAGTYPERIKKLILLDSFGPLVTSVEDTPALLRTHIEHWQALSSKKMPVYPDVRKAAVARVVVGDLSFELALLLAQRGTHQVPGGVTWRTDPRLRMHSAFRLSEAHARAFLAGITAPTLVILAEQGLDFIRAAFESRRDCVKHVQTLDLPGGHHVHMEQPEAAAKAIVEFIQ